MEKAFKFPLSGQRGLFQEAFNYSLPRPEIIPSSELHTMLYTFLIPNHIHLLYLQVFPGLSLLQSRRKGTRSCRSVYSPNLRALYTKSLQSNCILEKGVPSDTRNCQVKFINNDPNL